MDSNKPPWRDQVTSLDNVDANKPIYISSEHDSLEF